MDPTVTWEILSRLSKSGSDDSFPFFAQRQVASATDVDTFTNNSQCHWFMTCPPIQGITTSSSSINALPSTDNAVENNNINTSAAEAVSTTILYSQDAIIQEFLYVLQKQNDGRISASEMSIELGMEEDKIVTIGNILCNTKLSSSPATNKCCKVYNPTKKQYEYALVDKLQCTLRDRIDVLCNTKLDSTFLEIEPEKIIMDQSSILVPISTVTVNQLSHELKISCDNITKLLEDIRENLPPNITISKRGTVIEVYTCSYEYRMEYLEKHILSGLGGVTVPTSLQSALFGQPGNINDDDIFTTISSIANTLCQNGKLEGTLSSTQSNTIYTPNIYIHTQNEVAKTYYETNGYITEKKCNMLGISRSKMGKLVQEFFPKAVMLQNTIIDVKKICHPVEVAVQNALLAHGFADLRSELPNDIGMNDVKEIIDAHLVDMFKDRPQVLKAFEDGIIITNENMVFFFCSDMIKSCKELLPLLIEEYSKEKAKRDGSELTDDIMLPLRDVVSLVGEKYPELRELQHQYNSEHGENDKGKMLLWNLDVNDTNYDGPLVEFCRLGIFSDELQPMCIRSVKAEIDRIDATRHGVSVSTHSEGAATIQNIGESLETNFRALCHLIQLFSKSYDTILARNTDIRDIEKIVNEMKRELLIGCGSYLARLITEYYLFMNETDDDELYFESSDEKDVSSTATQSYLRNVDLASLQFPCLVLKCRPDKSGNAQCPLAYLRTLFPGNAGFSLAQMWSHCTLDESDEEGEKDAGIKLELFIRHLETDALSLVGIPFSILDKKTEKNVLSARRDRLLERLEGSTEEKDVSTISTVLIYQQIKNISILGEFTISSVLKVLFERDSKKIPPEVTKSLQILASNDGNVDDELIQNVKSYGAAKNSKALVALVAKTD